MSTCRATTTLQAPNGRDEQVCQRDVAHDGRPHCCDGFEWFDETLPVADPVKPRHYKDLSPEPIDVIASWKLGFNLGCVLKYVARADLKGQPVTDLRKAAAYLAHEIDQREKANRKLAGAP